MTLDAAEIDLSRAFDKGMGYVALSRVKRLENISLLGLNETALEVSPRIKALDADFWEQSGETEKYLAHLGAGANGAEGVRHAQKEFLRSVKEDGDSEFRYEIDEVPVVDFE